MPVVTLVSVEEYLSSTYHPDCDYVDGHLLERNVGRKRHSYTQTLASGWFGSRKYDLKLQPLVEQRIEVAPGRFRIPDVLLVSIPMPDEEVFTQPPYLCLEVMSPDDTMSSLQDRLDDYLGFGVPNVWVIDPWKRRAWTITQTGWHTALDGALHSADGRIALPLAEVLPEDAL